MGTVKKGGGWVMGWCPVHPDGEKHGRKAGQSLGLSEAGVLRCFAGCEFGEVIKALRDGAGVRPLPRPASASRGRQDDRRGNVTAIYCYPVLEPTKAREIPTAEHVRYETPNPGSVKGYDKRYGWRISESDTRTLHGAGLLEEDLGLYGLRSLEGISPDSWVNVCEGESVADALHARNEAAVTACGGASQRAFGAAWQPLRGAKVRAWPDNDPGGIEYMGVIKRQLEAAGASKVVIMPPIAGPPGTDLVNHFKLGGTLDQLLSDILEEDAVSYVGDDHFRVRLATEAGEVVFDAAELADGPRDLHCSLSVTWKSGFAEHPWQQHINLLSPSGCEALARVLGKHFSEANLKWVSIINRAVSHIRRAFDAIDIIEVTEPDPDAKPAQMITVKPVPMVEGGGTILYSLPKRGKSQLAIATAVAVDAGLSGGIFGADRARPVLYINLERSRQSMLARLARVNRALGLDPRRPLRFVHARGSGLARILSKVRKASRDHGIEVVILDSITRGGFGNLNDGQNANAWIDALNSLKVSWLAIGHSPRPTKEDAQAQQHLYGSVFQDAGADVMVSLVSKPVGTDKLLVSLKVAEANDFARPPVLDLVYEFDHEGLIAIRKADAEEAADLEEVKTLTRKQEVLASLRDEGAAAAGELAKRLDRDRRLVSRDLASLSKEGMIRRGTGEKWVLTPEAHHSSASDAHHDARAEHHTGIAGSSPPVGGSPSDAVMEPDARETCSRCNRERSVVASYHPDSTEDELLPLCPACDDDVRETVAAS